MIKSIMKHSTAQHSTAQHSTAQHSQFNIFLESIISSYHLTHMFGQFEFVGMFAESK
jgi:hypothetical protein